MTKGQPVAGCIDLQLAICAEIKPSVSSVFLEKESMSQDLALDSLSQEQRETSILVERLLGKAIADRYVDLCCLSAGTPKLRVSKPMAAHALRELESTLRTVLAVPFDATSRDDEAHRARRENAQTCLKDMGFDEAAAKRAAEALKPRLNHRMQIERICERLELGANAEVAKLWISLHGNFGVAHRRSFHQSLEVDEDFRAQYQHPFDVIIRAVLEALQRQYLKLVLRVDELLAMPEKRQSVKLFAREIPGADPLQCRFYDKLDTGDWLEILTEQQLLEAPLWDPNEDPARLRYRNWPAGSYLTRMASSSEPHTRKKVLAAIRKVADSDHPAIQQCGLEILAALPIDESRAAMPLAIIWLNRGGDFILQSAAERLLLNLAKADAKQEVLELGQALLQLRNNGDEIVGIYAEQTYQTQMPIVADTIVKVCGLEGLRLLLKLFLHAGHASDEFKYDDYADNSVGNDDDAAYSIFSALQRAVRIHAIELVEVDVENTRPVIDLFAKHPERICQRLALHVLAQKPEGAPDLATSYLENVELLEATWCQHEYSELAIKWFPSLPTAARDKILNAIDLAPKRLRENWRRRVENGAKAAPTPDQEHEFEVAAYRDLTWRWRSVLPTDRQEALATIVERIGDPDAWKSRLLSSETSPLTLSEIASKSLSELDRFLREWRPPSNSTLTTHALAQVLRSAVEQNPTLFADSADQLAELDPVYVREVLEGLNSAARNKRLVNWKPILTSIGIIQAREIAQGCDSRELWKPAAELLESGLRLGPAGIHTNHSHLVEALVVGFVRSARGGDLGEGNDERFPREPYFVATQTRKGMSVELCILLVWWLSGDKGSEVGRHPRNALALLPQIRSALEDCLKDRSTEGRFSRAICGRYLTYLFFYGEGWLRTRLDELLLDDATLGDASWSAHLLSDRRPISELLPETGLLYEREIRRLPSDGADRDEKRRATRLADYLLTLHFWDNKADRLVELFLEQAPAWLRAHAIVFASGQAALSDDKVPQDVRQRIFGYWAQRLAKAKSSTDVDEFRLELGAVSQWFARDTIDDDWLLTQLLDMLRATFVPTNGFMVIRRLAKMHPRYVEQKVEALALMFRNPLLDRWTFADRSPTHTILSEVLTDGSAEARKLAQEVIGQFAARGDNSFVDLVSKG